MIRQHLENLFPGFFRRQTQRVHVGAKFYLDNEGYSRFGEELPLDLPMRRFLRLMLPDRSMIEVRCDPFVYSACEEGADGIADLQGKRMLSFRRLSDVSNLNLPAPGF